MKTFLTQVTDQKYYTELVKPAHMAYIGMSKGPAVVDERLNNVYELMYGDENIVSMVNKFDKHYVDQDVYKWMLRGPSERNIPLIECSTDSSGSTVVTTSTTTKVGLGYTPFYLWFPERYFSDVSVLGGNRPEEYLVRVIEPAVQVGSRWRYKVIIYGGTSDSFIPVEELLGSTRWSDMFAPGEQDLSKQGSWVKFSSHYELQNRMMMIRKELKVTGSMIQQGGAIPLLFEFQTDEGKVYKKWIDYATWEFYKQCRQDEARAIMYGQSTINSAGQATQFGVSGNPILSGYGLYQQMNSSNIMYYNSFSIDALTDFAMKLTVGKLSEDSSKFVLSSGKYGLYQFHKAAERYLNTKAWFRSDHNLQISGNTATMKEGQISQYQSVNGIEFTLMYDAMLDSPTTVGKIPHPNGGWVSSYIYNIWDIGTQDGKPNIRRVAVKGDEEYTRYIAGMRDPFTPNALGMNPQPAATPVDGYEVHKMKKFSVMLTNPLRSGRIIPSIYRSSL